MTQLYSESAMALLNALCEKVGVDPNLVREVRVSPRSITVEMFEVNENGSKFIGADGNVALKTRTLPFQPSF